MRKETERDDSECKYQFAKKRDHFARCRIWYIFPLEFGRTAEGAFGSTSWQVLHFACTDKALDGKLMPQAATGNCCGRLSPFSKRKPDVTRGV
eukprot:497092-Amphidinium_carterae.2